MDSRQKLELNKMIKAHNVEDMTNNIREKKHSDKIKIDVDNMIRLKKEYEEMGITDSSIDKIIENQCNFLFTNYTDIYNRLKKNELDINILNKFLKILKQIEDGKIDQHEGAFFIGKYLKEIYIDSALKRGQKLDEKYNTKSNSSSPKNISWTQFKNI